MKALLTLVLGSFLALSSIAQTTSTVTITFRGINKGTNNYQVMLDATSYYSNNNSRNVPNYKIILKNVQFGTHMLKVYRLNNNNSVSNNGSQNTSVYSKNFEISQGYNMNITILPNGRVQFSEQSALNNNQSTVKNQMADYEFNQLLQSVRSKWSQSLKATAVRDAFVNTGNYFSTAQIRQLLSLITSESNRLDLAKASYRSVTDPLNFTQLSDMFSSSANRNEFNNYASLNTGQTITNYTVKTQMTDYQFNQLLQSVQDKWSQSLKGEAERDAFANTSNYFSTAQIRQLLSLITSESDRLDLAKLSYRSVMDPVNFAQLSDLFYTSTYRNDFNNYVRTEGGQVINTTVKTAMSDSEFNALVLSIRSNLLQILKVSAERDVFNNPNNFFTTSQVKQLISLINSESNRLELAKLSYRTVIDRGNFTQLYDLFNSQASKDALANYVNTNQNL